MRWTTLIDANENIRTGLLVASEASRIIKSRAKLAPYIVDWSYLLDSAGCVVMRLNVVVLNRSQADMTVSQVLLAARENKSLNLTPHKLRTAWRGNARIRLDDRRTYDVCTNDEILELPSTVTSGMTVTGWVAFVIESSQTGLIKQHKWCIAVVDQDGRQYRSRVEQDQSID
ncbi:MAG TPA: hypothetical protein G4O10_05905 [Dehalococcoidia bacterium]|nr:hypothetical protein [Dehalococcoidia bacterium]